MRKRAREREGLTEEEEEEVKKRGKERATDRHQHINFFADLEQGVSTQSHIGFWTHRELTCGITVSSYESIFSAGLVTPSFLPRLD